MKSTIDEHISYLASLPEDLPKNEETKAVSWKAVIKQYDTEEQTAIDEKLAAMKEGTEETEGVDLKKTMDEQEFTYFCDSIRLDQQKQTALSQTMKDRFCTLKKYRVLIHREILIHLLFFLGYTKQQIYLPNTNLLNWKHVRNLLDDQNFFNLIANYNPVGAKAAQVKSYQKLNYIKAKLEDIRQRDIEKYNMGFGRVF